MARRVGPDIRGDENKQCENCFPPHWIGVIVIYACYVNRVLVCGSVLVGVGGCRNSKGSKFRAFQLEVFKSLPVIV